MASATQTRPKAPEPEVIPPGSEFEEDRELEDSSALVKLNKGELEMQMEFARKYPRSMDRVMKMLKERTCFNQAIALEMTYSLPRGGKSITGASSRFAEILAACWGNNMSLCRVVGSDSEFVRAQGIYFDCESNYRHGREVARRITDSQGKRFNADMIGVTGMAAASIAFRNAVLNGIGKGVWYATYLETQKVAVGSAESVVKQRDQILEWAKQAGVTFDMLYAALQVQGIQDIIGDKFLALKIMQKEVMAGDKSIDEVFGTLETANIEAAMTQLNWNEGNKVSSRMAFKGRPQEHLQYLKDELGKRERAGIAAGPAPAKQQEAKPAAAPAQTQERVVEETPTQRVVEERLADPVPSEAPKQTPQAAAKPKATGKMNW